MATITLPSEPPSNEFERQVVRVLEQLIAASQANGSR